MSWHWAVSEPPPKSEVPKFSVRSQLQAIGLMQHVPFNCVPQIDVFRDNGFTKEDVKMVWETRKIMEDHRIMVNTNAVRFPSGFRFILAIPWQCISKLERKSQSPRPRNC
jgi:aspartate-semialdehyde dehydrogenase